MEEQIFRVKIVTCQRCFQHYNIDPHNQMEYFELYEQIKNKLSKINIKCVKNVPFKHLVKMPDTKHCSKRYLNHCTNKIVQFPQRGSFEVYFLNIVLYSKLEIGVFPDINTLIQVIKKLRDIYCEQPLLQQFQNFKCLELEWNKNISTKPSLIGSLNLYLPAQKDQSSNYYSQQTLDKAISFLTSSSLSNSKQKILPYSFYGQREKQHKIGNIYCPKSAQKGSAHRNLKITNNHHRQQNLSNSRDTKTMRIAKNKCKQTQSQNKHLYNYKKASKSYNSIFNMVRIGTAKAHNQTNKGINCDIDTQRFDEQLNFSANNKIYFSNTQPSNQKKIKRESKSALHRSGPFNQRSSQNVRINKPTFSNRIYQGFNTGDFQEHKFNQENIIKPVSHFDSSDYKKPKNNRNRSYLLPSENQNYQSTQKRSFGRLSQASRISKCQRCCAINNSPSQNYQYRLQSSRNQAQIQSRSSLSGTDSQVTQKRKDILKSVDRSNSSVQRVNQSLCKSNKSQIKNHNGQKTDQSLSFKVKINNSHDFSYQIQQKTQNSNKQDYCIQLGTSRPKKKTTSNQQQNLKQNNKQQSQQQLQIDRAEIVQNFAQIQNFRSELPQQCYLKTYCEESEFKIEANPLIPNSYYIIKSIGQVYKPGQVKLFPQLFKPIKSKSKERSTLLFIQVVNLIIKKNPQIITRIFENKKKLNNKGIYCVWLQGRDHLMSPIIINDRFAFYKNNRQPVYASKDYDSAIWVMLLEKAVAKVLGGYEKIQQATLSQLFRIILGCPTIEMKSFNPNNIQDILAEKLFLDKKAYIYTLNQKELSIDDNLDMFKIQRIIGFEYNNITPLQSKVNFQTATSKISFLPLQDFLVEYTSISLVFFNWNYKFNQKIIPKVERQSSQLFIVQLQCNTDNSTTFIRMGNLNQNFKSKIVIYKKITEQEIQSKICQQNEQVPEQISMLEYIGQITKKGSFFFQTNLNRGNYICLLQSKHIEHQSSVFKIYSQATIKIGNFKQHESIEQSKILQCKYHPFKTDSFIQSKSLKRKLNQSKLDTKQLSRLQISQIDTNILEKSNNKPIFSRLHLINSVHKVDQYHQNVSQRALILKQLYGMEFQTEKTKYLDVLNRNIELDIDQVQKEIFKEQYNWTKMSKIKGFTNGKLFDKKSICSYSVDSNNRSSSNFRKVIKMLGRRNQFFIIRLFENITQCQLGFFGVWICVHYEWKCIIVNDLIPVDLDDNPLFSYHQEKQIWPFVLQKALALVLGGYDKLLQIPTNVIFHMLTGSNFVNFKVREQASKNNQFINFMIQNQKKVLKNQKFLSFLTQNQKKNFIIHAQKIDTSLEQRDQNDTSVYYILGQKVINDGQVLLKMRQQKKKPFLIKLEYFANKFQSVQFLQLRTNHNNTFLKVPDISSDSNLSVFELTFEEPQFGSITLSNSQLSNLKTYLYKQEQDNVLRMVGQARQKQKKKLFFDCFFQQGKYYIFVQSDKNGSLLSYFGQGTPSLALKQKIQQLGFKNESTEYVALKSSLNIGNRRGSMPKYMCFDGQKFGQNFGSTISKTGSKLKGKQKIDKAFQELRSHFVQFLLQTKN